MKINFRFGVLTFLRVLLVCTTPLVAQAQMQLFDGERNGLFIGGGIGYAAARSDEYAHYYDLYPTVSLSGFTTSVRIT